MNKYSTSGFITLLSVLSFLLFPFIVKGQIQYGGTPVALQTELPPDKSQDWVKSHSLNNFHQDLRNEILTEIPQAGQPMQAGFSLPVNYHPLKDGVWTQLGDSLWVWRLQMQVEKAHGIGMILEEFALPENARIFIYNETKDYYVGAFTHRNNNEFQVLSVQAIPGDLITIEYQEKTEPGKERFSQASFRITELVYLVNGLMDFADKNLGSSDYCMINVNCSEGSQWQAQKRGVARMLMRKGNSWYWCSGSLVNTTRQDGTPYLLTADHCGQDASFQDMNIWQFYFNFERPGCENTGNVAHNVLYGCKFISNGPLDGGSDFKLLMLNQHPPLSWRPYYNGWNIMDIPSDSGVGIHHPAGDAKKISTYEGGVVSGGGSFSGGEVMADDAAWRFSFVETENGHGVTQGGSSGSPMFNSQGLIVGTLSGGSSSCSSPGAVNIYGKLSYHWESNGEYMDSQLKQHLNPHGNNITFLRGYDPHAEAHPAPGFVTSELLDGADQVRINWLKPGHAPNKEGWYSYTRSFEGVRKDAPERSTVFDAAALGFSYPVTLTKVSHVFQELPGDAWQNDQFTFRIYDKTGTNVIYASSPLTAVSLEEMEYVLETPLIFEDKFYISVRSTHPTGHPSSVYNLTNFGNALSFVGTGGNWEPVGNNANHFVFLTSIYIESNTQYPEQPDKGEEAVGQILHARSQQSKEAFPKEDKWADMALSYQLFKNNELIETITNEPGIVLSFTDDISTDEAHFFKYHLVANYFDFDSYPSNSTYVFMDQDCSDVITQFPFLETFNETQPDECWSIRGISENGWQITNQWHIEEAEVELTPEEGNNFMMVEPLETSQDEWLISPVLDLSELEVPAIRFSFSGNFISAHSAKTSQLSLYISYSENTFVKIWDSSDSPNFMNSSSHIWVPVTIDLNGLAGDEPVRFGFQYEGENGDYFAIDKIEILDAVDNIYSLSIVQFPLASGEVLGAGNYLAGEKVTVSAYANRPWFFQSWTEEEEMMSWRYNYSFTMPENDFVLTANFTEDNIMSVDDASEQGDVILYPNPSKGNLSVKTSQNHHNLVVEVYNTAGMLVQRINKLQLQAGEILQLDLSGEAPGLYILVLNSDQAREVSRFSLSE